MNTLGVPKRGTVRDFAYAAISLSLTWRSGRADVLAPVPSSGIASNLPPAAVLGPARAQDSLCQ